MSTAAVYLLCVTLKLTVGHEQRFQARKQHPAISSPVLPSELGKVCITSSPWLSLSFYGLLLSIRKKLRHSPSVFSSLFVPLCFHLCPSFGWIPTSTSHQVLKLMALSHCFSDLIGFLFTVIKISYFQYSLCHSAPAALSFIMSSCICWNFHVACRQCVITLSHCITQISVW